MAQKRIFSSNSNFLVFTFKYFLVLQIVIILEFQNTKVFKYKVEQN